MARVAELPPPWIGVAGLPWIGLAGPTASGKSAVALGLARHLPIEIVSVDSAQVYRGMDIGTAKPSLSERAAAVHHLIDILEPSQAYSAAAFVADARAAIAGIRARGRVPLLVGGTMLYFHALMHGLDAMPAADPAVRARLDAEAAAHGWPALHARLTNVDPITAARLAPNDAQRIQRALEVYETSGRPLSAWQQRGWGPAPGRSQGGPAPLGGSERSERGGPGPAARPASTSSMLVSLEPSARAWLHQRIAVRFDAMLDAGLLDEVRALKARGDLLATMPSMRCVGYRQAWQALDTGRMEGLRDAGIAATRQLAKRQITWLRSMTGRHVIACDDDPQRVFDAALARVTELTKAG